jgi:hypothetical protein
VFYISGFDPRGPSAYHKLYSDEAPKHFAQLGQKIEVSERKNTQRVSSWKIKQGETTTDYDFLRWDDIIRKYWIKNPLTFLRKSISFYIYVFTQGIWRAIKKTSGNVGFSIIYPILVSVIISLLAMGIAKIFTANTIVFWLITAALVYGGFKLASKLSVFWILRINIFYQELSLTNNAALNERAKEFAAYIISELQKDDHDEYILACHSVGTSVAVNTLNEIIAGSDKPTYSKLKIVSLGQCIPILTCCPAAVFFREQLSNIAKHGFIWLDSSSPSDGVCFALTSPFVHVAEENSVRLKLITPRFHKMFSVKAYKKIRRNKFRTHFQYLMAGDNLAEYSYFDITADNKVLESRYGTF